MRGLLRINLIKESPQANRHAAQAIHEALVGGELIDVTPHAIKGRGEVLQVSDCALELAQGLRVIEDANKVEDVGRGVVEVVDRRLDIANGGPKVTD